MKRIGVPLGLSRRLLFIIVYCEKIIKRDSVKMINQGSEYFININLYLRNLVYVIHTINYMPYFLSVCGCI